MTVYIVVLVFLISGVFGAVAVRSASYKSEKNDDYRMSTGQFGMVERKDRFRYKVYRILKKNYGDNARIFVNVPFSADRYNTEVIDLLAVTPDGLIPYFLYDTGGKGKLYIRGHISDPVWNGVTLNRKKEIKEETSLPSFFMRANSACTLLDGWIDDNALFFSDYRDNDILPAVCAPVVVYADRMVFQLNGNAPDWITWGKAKDIGKFIKARMGQKAWTGYDRAQISETYEDIFNLIHNQPNA